MATSTYNITADGVSLFSAIEDPGTNIQAVRGGFIVRATGTVCSIYMGNAHLDPGFAPYSQYRVDGGTWTDIPTEFSGNWATSLVTVFTGLSDTTHTVEIRVPNQLYNQLYVRGDAPCISVTGAAPALSFASGYGKVLIPDDSTGDTAKLQLGGGVIVTDGAAKRLGYATHVSGCFAVRWNHPASKGTTVYATSGDRVTLELWHRPEGGDLSFVASVDQVYNADSAFAFPLLGASNRSGDFFLLSTSPIDGIAVEGCSSTAPAVQIASTALGAMKKMIVSGTSLTVYAGVPGVPIRAPGNYPTILALLFKRLPYNFGFPGSCLTTPPDETGQSGVSREPDLDAVTDADIWLEAHAYNDHASTLAYFRDGLTPHLIGRLAANPNLKALVLGLESPGPFSVDVDNRAKFLGSVGTPGAIRQAATTASASVGTTRIMYVDSDPIIAAMLAMTDSGMSDGTHELRTATPTMAQIIYNQTSKFVSGGAIPVGTIMAIIKTENFVPSDTDTVPGGACDGVQVISSGLIEVIYEDAGQTGSGIWVERGLPFYGRITNVKRSGTEHAQVTLLYTS